MLDGLQEYQNEEASPPLQNETQAIFCHLDTVGRCRLLLLPALVLLLVVVFHLEHKSLFLLLGVLSTLAIWTDRALVDQGAGQIAVVDRSVPFPFLFPPRLLVILETRVGLWLKFGQA